MPSPNSAVDRQPHRDHRTEADQQDHDRREHRDAGARRRSPLLRVLDHLTAGFDLKAVAARGVGDRDDLLPHRLRDVVRALVELDRRVRDLPVLGDAGCATLVVGTRDPDDVRHVLDLLEYTPHLLLHRGVGDRRVGLEHDLGGVAGLARELGPQEVEGPLRLHVREREVVLVLAARGTGEKPEPDQSHEPEHQHQAAAAVGEAGEGGK
jgi:hypothetical protein